MADEGKGITFLRWRLSGRIWSMLGRVRRLPGRERLPGAIGVKCALGILRLRKMVQVNKRLTITLFWWLMKTGRLFTIIARRFFGNQQEQQYQVATSFGICMDINPYKFATPFTTCEFANRVLDSKSQLVVLSMAWLTSMDREELDSLAGRPEMDTFNYWVQRFWPLLKKRLRHDVNFDGDDAETGKKTVIVFANRAGEEAGPEGTNPALYAGTSAIVAVTQRPRPPSADGETSAGDKSSQNGSEVDGLGDKDTLPFDVSILCWDMMAATAEGICFADTTMDPQMVFGLVKASS
ncbi:hypothetical protein BDV23DRAFT_143743, partial [Aspergillus alliaceus]